MSYFPLYFQIHGKTILIAGAGNVALAKAKRLSGYGAKIVLCDPDPKTGQEKLPEDVTLIDQEVNTSLIEKADIFIAATDDPKRNAALCRGAREVTRLYNAVDDAEASSFIFPAIFKDGDLSIAVSTSGDSPAGAVWLRNWIKDNLPKAYPDVLEWIHALREPVLKMSPDQHVRAKIFDTLFDAGMKNGGPLAEEETEALIDRMIRNG